MRYLKYSLRIAHVFIMGQEPPHGISWWDPNVFGQIFITSALLRGKSWNPMGRRASVRLPGGIPSGNAGSSMTFGDFPAAMLDDQRILRKFKISQCTPHLISNNFHINPKKPNKNPRKIIFSLNQLNPTEIPNVWWLTPQDPPTAQTPQVGLPFSTLVADLAAWISAGESPSTIKFTPSGW